MGTFWLMLGGMMIIIIIMGIVNSKNRKLTLIKLGLDKNDLIFAGKYVSGHIDIDKSIPHTEIAVIENKLAIYNNNNNIPIFIASIPTDAIKNIIIEDASTMERRVTAGRMLLVGIFAFGLKKKKKDEMSYLIIEWSDGRFEHNTIFEFVKTGAIQKSNEARNKLMKKIR